MWRSTYLPKGLPTCREVCLPGRTSTYLPGALPTCLNVCLFARGFTYLHEGPPPCWKVHLPVCRPTYLREGLPTCRGVYLPVYIWKMTPSHKLIFSPTPDGKSPAVNVMSSVALGYLPQGVKQCTDIWKKVILWVRLCEFCWSGTSLRFTFLLLMRRKLFHPWIFKGFSTLVSIFIFLSFSCIIWTILSSQCSIGLISCFDGFHGWQTHQRFRSDPR